MDSEEPARAIREQTREERAAEILEGYRAAFSGFSEDEIALLNGVVLEPVDENGRG
jgi:hypothetical protein